MFFKIEMIFFHAFLKYGNECVATYNSVPPDPTMTVDNVTQILNKIPKNKWKRVMGEEMIRGRLVGLSVPWSLREEIQRRYSTDTEKNHACADYYVNYHPEDGWERLTRTLYFLSAFTAAKESKSFLSTGKSHNYGGKLYYCSPSPMHIIVARHCCVSNLNDSGRA